MARRVPARAERLTSEVELVKLRIVAFVDPADFRTSKATMFETFAKTGRGKGVVPKMRMGDAVLFVGPRHVRFSLKPVEAKSPKGLARKMYPTFETQTDEGEWSPEMLQFWAARAGVVAYASNGVKIPDFREIHAARLRRRREAGAE